MDRPDSTNTNSTNTDCAGRDCAATPLTLTCTREGDRTIVVTRTFASPRERIFAAYTQPSYLMHWFYGPEEYPILSCDIDLREGGALRYVWRMPGGKSMGLSGSFKRVVPNEHLTHTELFDDDWTDGEALVQTDFIQTDGRTIVATRVHYTSAATVEQALTTGMLHGWDMMLNRLDAYLASQTKPN